MTQGQLRKSAQQIRNEAAELSLIATSVEQGGDAAEAIDAVRARLGLIRFETFGPRNRAAAGQGARMRLLDHLQKHLGTSIHRDELAIVAGIQAWARRIRELRLEHGYDVEHLADGSYVLHRDKPDPTKADEWRSAHRIRNLEDSSVEDRVAALFRANVGRVVRRDQLDYVAKGKKEATRRARELRDERGWPIISHIDDPDLRPSEYMLLSDDPKDFADPRQRYYPATLREAVFKRDGYRCHDCRRTRQEASAAGDTRFFLECDHVIGVADPAELTGEQLADEGNFQTLCHRCHANKTAAFQRAQRSRRRAPRKAPD